MADQGEDCPEVGDRYRRRVNEEKFAEDLVVAEEHIGEIEYPVMRVERVLEDVNTGETLYYLVHTSANPDSILVTAEELDEEFERADD